MNIIASTRLWLARKLAPGEFARLRDYELNPKPAEFPPLGPFDTAAIAGEISRAVKKFPDWPTDPLHAIAIVNEEIGELNKALLQCAYEPKKTSKGEIRAEAIQVVTVAIRFLASFWQYEYTQCGQHRQRDGQ